MSKKSYPASYLYTMITELLREMDLPYKVSDVRTFGHDPDNGFRGSIWVEVTVRDAAGIPIGSERIERWIEEDVTYEDWGKPPTEYPVVE